MQQPCTAAHLLAGAGEKEHGVPRLLQARQGGAVRVKGREDDLPLARLLEHHLQHAGLRSTETAHVGNLRAEHRCLRWQNHMESAASAARGSDRNSDKHQARSCPE